MTTMSPFPPKSGNIKARRRLPQTHKKKKAKDESDDDDDNQPLRRKIPAKADTSKGKSKAGTDAKRSVKGKAAIKNEEAAEDAEAVDAEEDEYRWWEDPSKGDGSTKWKTLEHAGLVFPPPYEPLPQNVKLRYDGVPVTLHPDAEEVAGFFGAMLNSTVNVENPTFVKNFFHDFQEILKKTGGAKDKAGKPVKIKEFSKCDFTPIFDYYEAKKAEKEGPSGCREEEAQGGEGCGRSALYALLMGREKRESGQLPRRTAWSFPWTWRASKNRSSQDEG